MIKRKIRVSYKGEIYIFDTFWNSFCDYIRDEFCIKNTENAKKMF